MSLRRKARSLGVCFILLFSSLAFALDDRELSSGFRTNALDNTVPCTDSCCQRTLSESQVQSLWDLVYGEKPLVISELGDRDENRVREILAQSEVLLSDEEGTEALTTELPNMKIDPEEVPFLTNTTITGPFGIGLLLDDTLRLGRCMDGECALRDSKLNEKRYSDDFIEPVTETVDRNALDKVIDSFTGTDERITESVEASFEMSGNDTTTIETIKFVPGNPIENIVESPLFKAVLEADKPNILTYSAFDKHFNKAAGIAMVVTAFGPMIVSKFGLFKGLQKAAYKVNPRLSGPAKFDAGSSLGSRSIDDIASLKPDKAKRVFFNSVREEKTISEFLPGVTSGGGTRINTIVDPATGEARRFVDVRDFSELDALHGSGALDNVKFADDLKASKAYSDALAGDGMMPEEQFNRIVSGLGDNASYIRNNLDEVAKRIPRRAFSLYDSFIRGPGSDGVTNFMLRYQVMPVAYWAFKRGLFTGKFSAYALPQSWLKLELSHGTETVYDDAFVDFFANKEIDQDDLFQKFIRYFTVFGWAASAPGSEEHSVMNWMREKLQAGFARTEVDSIAYYSTTHPGCSSCTISPKLVSRGEKMVNASFIVPGQSSSYILEDTSVSHMKIGPTLISFSHHTDMLGKQNNEVSGDPIDLVQAQREGRTCMKKLEEVPLFNMGFLPKSASSLAYSLAAFETGAYVLNPGLGFTVTLLEMYMLMETTQGCIDDQEGHYIHFFIPSDRPSDESLDPAQSIISSGSEIIGGAFESGKKDSSVEEKVEEIKGQLTGVSESKKILQARLYTQGLTRGVITGPDLFYFWYKGEAKPNGYRTEGREVLTGENGEEVVLDYNKGSLEINGENIFPEGTEEQGDFVRLSYTNTNIPAKVIPQRITYVRLSGESLLFEVSASGELTVKDSAALKCITEGIKEQAGRDYSSSNLTGALGLVQSVTTEYFVEGQQYSYTVYPLTDLISAEGTPRKSVEGNGRIEVYSSRAVKLMPHMDPGLGNLSQINFRNGTMVYKPGTDLLIFWMNRTGELDGDEITGLRAKHVTSINPETECPEPAFDLETMPDPQSASSKLHVEEFNASLYKNGPYQIFETPTHIFRFMSKLEGDECVDYVRIFNKDTGETFDKIISNIGLNDDGEFVVTTNEGEQLRFGIDSESGRPLFSYNDLTEVLLRAQGRNGAFWYDPETGAWHTENGQLIPMLEAFRQNGIRVQANPDGSVTGQPANNFMFLPSQTGSGSGFQLPSVPENLIALALFVSACMLGFSLAYSRGRRVL